MIGDGGSDKAIALVKPHRLIFADVDVIINALRFEQDDGHGRRDHFALLLKDGEDFAVFRGAQGQALFSDLEFFELHGKKIFLLVERLDIVDHVLSGGALLSDGREVERIGASAVADSRQQSFEQLFLSLHVGARHVKRSSSD